MGFGQKGKVTGGFGSNRWECHIHDPQINPPSYPININQPLFNSPIIFQLMELQFQRADGFLFWCEAIIQSISLIMIQVTNQNNKFKIISPIWRHHNGFKFVVCDVSFVFTKSWKEFGQKFQYKKLIFQWFIQNAPFSSIYCRCSNGSECRRFWDNIFRDEYNQISIRPWGTSFQSKYTSFHDIHSNNLSSLNLNSMNVSHFFLNLGRLFVLFYGCWMLDGCFDSVNFEIEFI